MNKELVTRCFARAAGSYEEEAAVQRQIAAQMTSLLHSRIRPGCCRKILELGCGTGLFSRMLADSLKPEQMLLNDICPEMRGQLKDLLSDRIRFERGDAETHPFDGPYDLIASCSTVQWFKDIGAFFTRTHPLLTADGILAFSTFGRDNIKEVTSLTGKGLAYLSPEELTHKLSGLYELLYVREEKILKRFRHPKEVLYHLKRTGVTGVARQRWTKTDLTRFCDAYRALYRNGDDEVVLTYHPIYVIAKRK
jgi:malonyl-ACP O-methyltransferase BioC